MEKLKHLLGLLTLLTSMYSQSQILVGGEENKDSKEDKPLVENSGVKPQREMDNNTSLHFHFNRSRTFRSLTPNDGIFGDSLGKRGDEEAIKSWAFALRFQTVIAKGFEFGAGLGYQSNGEKYLYQGNDSSFTYTTVYRYISMPLILSYHVGDEFRVTGYAGIVPAAFVSSKRNQTSVNEKNTSISSDTLIKTGSSDYNSFVVSGVIGAYASLKYSKYWSIYVGPEYRFQMNSTYSKYNPYIHKARAFGVSFGLIYQL